MNEMVSNDMVSNKVVFHFQSFFERVTVLNNFFDRLYAFKQKGDKCTPRQLRHLNLIGQFTTDIRYLKGSENVVADALSRIHISTINAPSVFDFSKMAREQQKDSQLQDILAGACPTSLMLQPFPVGQPPITLHCDVSMVRIRPFVPEIF
ncbi:retrovirus-related Pol polyprotein from transposon 297 [Trichonephila clavipes]|nr:retrovirus-related Pol polyprotein from transposon 297 [Trichonephila clavipes]